MERASIPSSPAPRSPGAPEVPMETCPIAATLGTLGRKWALTILRDVAFFPDASFTLILRSNPGLRPRTLSLRLKQLASEDLIEKSVPVGGSRRRNYRLSAKGAQVWPILGSLLQFGVQNHAERVFADGQPRNLEDVFPGGAELMLGRFAGGVANLVDRRSASALPSTAASRPRGLRATANRSSSVV
ncbi:MAG: helix-turn-helix transcriptional regulator [Thermoplasmata archaeon]|nr:helix-turn-helix transcriptional regulator [Thermoplasmata archaeon]